MADANFPGVVDGYRVDDKTQKMKQTIQAVGNFTAKYTSGVLKTLAASAKDDYPNIINGTVYLTGFKLESVLCTADQQIDNAKVVPLINGDSITLTNICKAGTLSFNASRTAGGLNDGDCVSIFDYVRSQGDTGGALELSWLMNGAIHHIIFSGVCVKRVPPLNLAGNDVPDYNVQLTYANYSDEDSPAYNAGIASQFM